MPREQMAILVVEDSPDNQLLATHYLREGGFRPVCVDDGAKALAYLNSHDAPAAIVLDLSMPILNGWEFLEAQRVIPKIAAIPIIIFSSESHFRLDRGLVPNVVSCISKSEGWTVLLMAVNFALFNSSHDVDQ
jgi:CheY-like chemotaxis protein